MGRCLHIIAALLSVMTMFFISAMPLPIRGAAPGQAADGFELTCGNQWHDDRYLRTCEIKEQRLPSPGDVLTIDGQRNGEIIVKGWERGDALMRMRVEVFKRTAAETRGEPDARMRELALKLKVNVTGGVIRAEGLPDTMDDVWWAVGYEVYVPRDSNLLLKNYNGNIRVQDVRGRVECESYNGDLWFDHLSGTVRGRTHNGNLRIRLAGKRWGDDGAENAGLDAETYNGNIQFEIPADYSARIEAGTTTGKLTTDFPVTQKGGEERNLMFAIGEGSTKLRAVTYHGSVAIKRT